MSRLTKNKWHKLSWEEAQIAVVNYLKDNGYISLHEVRLEKGRADGLVIFNKLGKAIVGIVEIKHYNSISYLTQKLAVKQALSYFTQIEQEFSNKYKKRDLKFFILVVFTKDYPTKNMNCSLASLQKLSNQTLPKNLDVIVTSVRHLHKRLIELDLIFPAPANLDQFFEEN